MAKTMAKAIKRSWANLFHKVVRQNDAPDILNKRNKKKVKKKK